MLHFAFTSTDYLANGRLHLKRKTLFLTRLVSGLIALTLLLAGMMPAYAQDQSSALKMEAWAAFDGNFKYGEWLPLWVQLENSGPNVDGDIQVRVTGRGNTAVYSAPATMPTGSRKLIPLYALPNNFSHALEVQFVSGNRVIAKESVIVRAQPNINYLVGIASPERGGLSMLISANLPGKTRKIVLVDFSLADLPDRPEGLRSFDSLIINNLDTSSLSVQQRSALETWVRQGGRLVLGGGAGLLTTASGLPASLLPAVPQGFEQLDELPGLARYAGNESILVQGPFAAAALNSVTPDASILVSEGDLPLVIEKSLGSGFVDLVALDLASSPFNAWAGTTPFWEKLLGPNSAYSDYLPPDMSTRQMAGNSMMYALSNLPSLDLPSIRGLALLLLFYILLVGPVNYLVLRWRKRLHWAWVTIPMVTLIFSGSAFGLGYMLRGSDLLLNQVVIAELQPGGTAYTRSYFGLFSPSQTSYEIEVSGGGLISQLNVDYDPWSSRPSGGGEVVMVQGEPSLLRGLAVNQWSMQAFTTEGFWDEVGGLSGDIVLDGSVLRGSLTNNTGLNLQNAVLIIGNQIIRLGELPNGESKPIQSQVNDLMGPVFGPPISYRIFESEFNTPQPGGIPRELTLKQSILDSLMPYGGGFASLSGKFGGAASGPLGELMFLGWFDTSPDAVRVGGRTPAAQTTALLYTSVPYSISTEGSAYVPAGLIPGTLVEIPFEGGQCGSGTTPSVYLSRGKAVFEFRVPSDFLTFNIENLLVQIGTEGGWMRVPEAAVYDWGEDEWLMLERPQAGTNKVAFQPDLLSSASQVRVQLSSEDGFSSGCYYLGLGLEGRQ
jgi:hypothetical protein